ncbi:hypothetical protein ACTA71_009715 [Dictyostelium dimigraforme]
MSSKQVYSTNDSISSKKLLEDYNPFHQLFSAYAQAMNVEFPLNDKDYVLVIQTALSFVPVVGGPLSSCFAIVWGKFFPEQDQGYVTKDAFEKRISKLYKDMESKFNQKLDNHTKNCETLLKGGDLFHEAINVYLLTKKNGNYKGLEQTKVIAFVNANHSIFVKSLHDSLIFFGNEKYVKLTIKLYLETAAIYIALLKDTLAHGKEWGLPDSYLNGGSGVKSIKEKIHDAIEEVFKTFKVFLTKFKENDTNVPDWSILVSTYLHGDITLYPHSIKWLKPFSTRFNTYSYCLPEDITSKYILAIDACQLNRDGGNSSMIFQGGWKPYNQSCDWITNSHNVTLSLSNSTKAYCYTTLWETVDRSVSFRMYMSSNGADDNDFKVKVSELDVKQLDDSKEKNGLSKSMFDSGEIKVVNETWDYMKISQPFKQSFNNINGPLELHTSKQFKFEKNKAYFVEFSSTNDAKNYMFNRLEIFLDESKEKKQLSDAEAKPSINVKESKPTLIDLVTLGTKYLALESTFQARVTASGFFR